MKTLKLTAALVLALHGLVHLMGTTSYLQLGGLQVLPYKTTLLNGRWDVGAAGMSVYGVLWAAAALGFVVAAVAFWVAWGKWRTLLTGVTLFSLVLTALDSSEAFVGIIVNLIILALLAVGPRWFTANREARNARA